MTAFRRGDDAIGVHAVNSQQTRFPKAHRARALSGTQAERAGTVRFRTIEFALSSQQRAHSPSKTGVKRPHGPPYSSPSKPEHEQHGGVLGKSARFRRIGETP